MKSVLSAIALVASVLPLVSAAPLNAERDAEADFDIKYITELKIATAWATVYATEGAPAPETTTTTTRARGRKTRTWKKEKTTTTTYAEPTSTYVAPVPETTSTYEEPKPTYEAPTTTEQPAWTWPTYAPEVPATTHVPEVPKPIVASGPSVYNGDGAYSQENLKAAIINSTNTYRSMFQAPAAEWNQTLANQAQADANKCVFEHTNAGQNLAAGYGGPQGAVGGWGDEFKDYDFSHPDFSSSTGHFTQLVWQTSLTVGCAAKKCPTDGSTSASGWYLICNYFPVGNYLGEFGENVKSKSY